VLSFIDEIHAEAGRPAEPPLRKVAVAAIVHNPFAGAYQADLGPLVAASADVGRETRASRSRCSGRMRLRATARRR
jgi:hypothetical protein